MLLTQPSRVGINLVLLARVSSLTAALLVLWIAVYGKDYEPITRGG
jgi:hypothetical protein